MKASHWLIAATLIAVSTTAKSVERGESAVYTGEYAHSALETLDDSIWASSGNTSDKHIYVIYGTQCGYSKQFYEKAKALSDDVEVRWIAHGGKGAAAVASDRSAKAVLAAFNGTLTPAIEESKLAAYHYNFATVKSLGSKIMSNNGRTWSYPIIIYPTEDGTKVKVGSDIDVAALENELTSRPGKGEHTPAGIQIVDDSEIIGAPSLEKYVNRSGKTKKVLAFANDESPVIYELENKTLLKAVGVTENGYVAVGFSDGDIGFIHDPIAVELAKLKYDIKPTHNEFVAENRSHEILSHPSPKAEKMTSLPEGYVVRAIGSTTIDGKQWVVVNPYSDDTKGFIAVN